MEQIFMKLCSCLEYIPFRFTKILINFWRAQLWVPNSDQLVCLFNVICAEHIFIPQTQSVALFTKKSYNLYYR